MAPLLRPAEPADLERVRAILAAHTRAALTGAPPLDARLGFVTDRSYEIRAKPL